jgi:hypothetical protein
MRESVDFMRDQLIRHVGEALSSVLVDQAREPGRIVLSLSVFTWTDTSALNATTVVGQAQLIQRSAGPEVTPLPVLRSARTTRRRSARG